jgi:transposase-like protein
MKAGTDRKYTVEFRDAAVKQVNADGRSMTAVARSLEMSSKALANWVYLTRAEFERRWRAVSNPTPLALSQ